MGTDTQPLLPQGLNHRKCAIILSESHTDRYGIDKEANRLIGMFNRGLPTGTSCAEHDILLTGITMKQNSPGTHKKRIDGETVLRRYTP